MKTAEELQAELDRVLGQLENQRTWRKELDRELAAARRELEATRNQLFLARNKIAGLEKALERAPIDVRVRVELAASKRVLGSINEMDAKSTAGWLVLAAEDAHVLEIRMLPNEWAKDAARRFESAASTSAHAMLLSELHGISAEVSR